MNVRFVRVPWRGNCRMGCRMHWQDIEAKLLCARDALARASDQADNIGYAITQMTKAGEWIDQARRLAAALAAEQRSAAQAGDLADG